MSGTPRDPQTGQFLPRDATSRFDRIEPVHTALHTSIPAADLSGTTGQDLGGAGAFEGVRAYDFDDILDRDEVGHIIWAHHRMVTYIGSTQSADGTVRSVLELSASPSKATGSGLGTFSDMDESPALGATFTVESDGVEDNAPVNTADVIGPQMIAVGYGPITDGTNGVGGAGSAGWDEWEGGAFADDRFDPRDEIFWNGLMEPANVSDAAAHLDAEIHHLIGVEETR